MKTKLLTAITASFGAIITANAAVTLVIDPVGGEQDGVEFDTVTGAGTISLADMQAAVTASPVGFAGVFDREGGNTGNSISHASTNFVINSTGNLNSSNGGGNAAGIFATSGTDITFLRSSQTWTFDLTGTGSTGLKALGFINAAWGGTFTWEMSVEATFSDSTTATLNNAAAAAAHAGGARTPDIDTWYGFQAPAGESITSVEITNVNATGGWTVIDDVAFVLEPVPEPSSSALLGLGLAGLVLRRRR